jgi:hypothetical protein
MAAMSLNETSVAEMQGLYGSFSFAEKLLQKIWLRRDFEEEGARLTDGRELCVVHPGKWNLLGGPDFKEARLAFGDGREVAGDVELHLRAEDWFAHRHSGDPAYAKVILHVVLFPPEPGHMTLDRNGGEIPLLVLLPLLRHDLESFVADETVETMAGRLLASAPDELAALAPEELLDRLREYAAERWRRKVRDAGLRLERLGWESACHFAALETLGYRYNRPPMLRIAARWPLAAWAARKVNVDEVYASELEAWSVQGVRPANHPRVRLRQYYNWVQTAPDWPSRLAELATKFPNPPSDEATPWVRKQVGFSALRTRIQDAICGGKLSGTRFDNLICDALFPLMSNVITGRFGLWFHWFAGDQPPAVVRVLHQLNVYTGRARPACQGWGQGLLGWLVAKDAMR